MTDPTHHGKPAASDVVAPLQQSLADLIRESQALRVDVHTAEAARKRANHINLGVLGLLILFVALLVGIGWQGNVTNQRIADCTTAGGDCYEEGRKRTAAAIGDIIKVSIYMAECARLYPGEAGPEYDRKLEACVYGRLAQPTAAPSVGG